MVHVDDLVQMRPEQAPFAALPTLLRSHHVPPLDQQAERITTLASKASPNRICKETEVPVTETGKPEYFNDRNHPRRSMTSEFSTDNDLSLDRRRLDFLGPVTMAGWFRQGGLAA